MTTNEILAFVLLSIPVIYFSRKVLLNPDKHGFARFFSWECIVLLMIKNYSYWFENPFSIYQVISWICLVYSAFLVITAVILFKKVGKPHKTRQDETLFSFEKTTNLIDTGIYKYVRHPMYGSLLFLSWGIYFKNTALFPLILSVLSSLFLIITVKIEEVENRKYFGESYTLYIKKSKMFIPFVL
jgi:protein-S-isoprenylcysteine O-methyltransferase Ste14